MSGEIKDVRVVGPYAFLICNGVVESRNCLCLSRLARVARKASYPRGRRFEIYDASNVLLDTVTQPVIG